jgi:hypothetical protein
LLPYAIPIRREASGLDLIRAVAEDLEELTSRIDEVFNVSPKKSNFKGVGERSLRKVSFGLNTYY